MNPRRKMTPVDGTSLEGKRFGDLRDAMYITTLGRVSVMNLAKQIGAAKHVGRRVIYDLQALTDYIEKAD